MCIVAIFCGKPATASLLIFSPHAGQPLCHPCDPAWAFTNIGLCDLLLGGNVTLGGAQLICLQYRHAISSTPFNKPCWLSNAISLNFVDLINLPFCFVCFSFINSGVLCHMPSKLLLSSAPFVVSHPLFWCITLNKCFVAPLFICLVDAGFWCGLSKC